MIGETRKFGRRIVFAGSLVTSLCILGSLGYATIYAPRRAHALMGPCSGGGRLASQDIYHRLALRLIHDRLYAGSNLGSNATQEKVDAQLARITSLRVGYLPTVLDACLAAHVSDWLDHFEREARGAMARKAELGGFSDEYEKRRAVEEDQRRALQSALGVKPATLECRHVP